MARRGWLLAWAWAAATLAAASAPDEGSGVLEPACCAGWPPRGGGAQPLPPRACWAAAGAEEARRWSLTILTRAPMEQIYFRGQLQEQPAYRPPLPVEAAGLCDGSQTGGGQCHYGVTRSYLRGLQLVGHERFTFNPPNASLYGDVIWALGGAGACAAAGDAKRSRPPGETFVVLGPNLQDVQACAAEAAPDLFIVPSLWVRQLAELGQLPGFGSVLDYPSHPIIASPAGVDTEFWKPSTPWPSRRRRRIVLYDKSVVSDGSISSSFVGEVEDILLASGRQLDVVRYGFESEGYTVEDFRAVLDESIVAVFLSKSESQGLALAEAWAMDVPTLVWQGPDQLAHSGSAPPPARHAGAHVPTDAAPYLTNETGLRFASLDELPALLAKVESAHVEAVGDGAAPARAASMLRHGADLPRFRPRDWVLRYMSDEAAVLYALYCIGRAREEARGWLRPGAGVPEAGVLSPSSGGPVRDSSRSARLMAWRERNAAEGTRVP
jgi:hypothetical protein